LKPIVGFAVFMVTFLSLSQAVFSQGEENNKIKDWHLMLPSTAFCNSEELSFYRFKTRNGSETFLAVFDLRNAKRHITPFYSDTSSTVIGAAHKSDAFVVTNGGYFNLSDGVSASSVTIDGKQRCNPRMNKALIGNAKLAPFLETIFNRSELRILEDSHGHLRAMICAHNDDVLKGYSLKHALQAGPRLLPNLRAEEEAFIRKEEDGKLVDSIGCRKTAARTAIGITSDQHLLMICVAGKGQNEFSSGITLNELADLLKELGCRDALNLDGGTSTSMAIKEGSCTGIPNLRQLCGREPAKLVKSGLMVIP
jgi:exopolysaccharide biosynthesis protein